MRLAKHTDREYEVELERLRERLIYMGAQVERQFDIAMDALLTLNVTAARKAIEGDSEIDALEIEIDELCLRVLAKRQPVASDLRFIAMTLKLVTDLERTGDLAANIAERVIELCGQPKQLTLLRFIEQMGAVAGSMLRDALDALVSADARKANLVLQRDRAVDAQYAQMFPAIAQFMTSDSKNLEVATRMQSIGKCIERLADHATNIAEMVIFMVEGKDVRHSHGATAFGREG